MTPSNQALVDELEAISSIYDEATCTVTKDDRIISRTSAVLKLPDLPFSFLIAFPADYPDAPPEVISTQSTGASTKIGQGEAATGVLRDVLGNIFVPGQVCLFDLIEETTPLLRQDFSDNNGSECNNIDSHLHDGDSQDRAEDLANRIASTTISASQPTSMSTQSQASSVHTESKTLMATVAPEWILSEAIVVNKSTFVARVLAVSSLTEATDSISHLLATNKRVATATHNITSWRIKQKQSEPAKNATTAGKYVSSGPTPEIIIQDCDDDGETAAGGRLLHLMQLMDVWNVVVVVTRWYGGVKLGPDRFQCINSVARDALVKGGFVRGEEDDVGKPNGKGKGKGKGKKK